MTAWRIGKRYPFVAVKKTSTGQYVCLREVANADTLTPFRDHVWIRNTRRFKDIPSDEPFFFTAKVNRYHSRGRRKLTLTNIRLNEV